VFKLQQLPKQQRNCHGKVGISLSGTNKKHFMASTTYFSLKTVFFY